MSEDKNSTSYSLGWEAWDVFAESEWITELKNPFKYKSIEWALWNRGWNDNLKGIAK